MADWFLAAVVAIACAEGSAPIGLVAIPPGILKPFFVSPPGPSPLPEPAPLPVAGFLLDRRPVTRSEFARFVRRHPEWRRSRAPSLYVDQHYLEDWRSDLEPGRRTPLDAPVTRVSWFAAQAYCEAGGKILPTIEQWEYAAAGSGEDEEARNRRILAWYGEPGSLPPGRVGRSAPNSFGVEDLHGLIWEWTLDFNSVMISSESREPGDRENPLFCGAGSVGSSDARNYATYMRYAMRNSLKAAYTTGNLGFRCAREAP